MAISELLIDEKLLHLFLVIIIPKTFRENEHSFAMSSFGSFNVSHAIITFYVLWGKKLQPTLSIDVLFQLTYGLYELPSVERDREHTV